MCLTILEKLDENERILFESVPAKITIQKTTKAVPILWFGSDYRLRRHIETVHQDKVKKKKRTHTKGGKDSAHSVVWLRLGSEGISD